MRKKIIAANWKMNKTTGETGAFLETFLREVGDDLDVDIIIIPPFTSLFKASDLLSQGSNVKLGAQNMSAEKSGAFTGEISAEMLRDLFARYVIIGHSERRTLFGETDEIVARKLRTAIDGSLKPILCVGETLEERDGGRVEEVLERQLRSALAGLDVKELAEVVIAYEPVWAIGTGRTATPEQAQETHAFVRACVAKIAGLPAAEKIRIQYGGSVKPDNALSLLSQPDIDGALVGGASLDPRGFAEIVAAAAKVRSE